MFSNRIYWFVTGVVSAAWLACVLKNLISEGQYKIPSEVHAAMFAIVTALWAIPFANKRINK